MPSPRSTGFVEAPPASEGLRAPSAHRRRKDYDDAAAHPGKPGRMTEQQADQVVALTLRLMDKLTPVEIAIEAGVSTSAKPVREIIRAARLKLRERADFYVEAHALATATAAANGDAKPAQWALTQIAEGEDRVIDPEAKATATGPIQLTVGFALGGVPNPAPVPLAIEGEVVK